MHDVFGQGLVPDDAQRHAEQAAAVLLVELAQGALVTTGAGLQAGVVIKHVVLPPTIGIGGSVADFAQLAAQKM
ncbi:hypothetical protein cym2001_34160 [Pseudomonas sp. CYM-20-01]|nr:hypothetical protein cym2001_34160 [Pseudomonas sp. CYM-20-01]